MNPSGIQRMDRRTSIKWVLTATAAISWRASGSLANEAAPPVSPPAQGYGTDPNLTKDYRPGDLWPLTLTDAQRRTAAALCDVIVPQDADSPAASAVGVVDFIDEWVSAPYPQHVRDRVSIVEGLAWINHEAQRRFARDFAELTEANKAAIADDICYLPKAKSELRAAAGFFARFRDLTAGGFYTTPAGMKDLKYVGNIASAAFDGPPVAVLEKAGLA